MRASDLLGRTVVDHDGRRLGVVIDLVCRVEANPDGPGSGPNLRRLRVTGLLVSPRRAGSLLGYGRAAQRGPWLLEKAITTLHGTPFTVALSRVATPMPEVAADRTRPIGLRP